MQDHHAAVTDQKRVMAGTCQARQLDVDDRSINGPSFCVSDSELCARVRPQVRTALVGDADEQGAMDAVVPQIASR